MAKRSGTMRAGGWEVIITALRAYHTLMAQWICMNNGKTLLEYEEWSFLYDEVIYGIQELREAKPPIPPAGGEAEADRQDMPGVRSSVSAEDEPRPTPEALMHRARQLSREAVARETSERG